VRSFIASSFIENKKIPTWCVLTTLPPHLTELSEVLQAVCFNFEQIKASVEMCMNMLSDVAGKSELKANCEKFDSELRNLESV